MSQADAMYIKDLEERGAAAREELENAIEKALDMHDLDDVREVLEEVS
jgi:hypothetical protein